MKQLTIVPDMLADTHDWAARWGGWRLREDVFRWCEENVSYWRVIGQNWYFENTSDALMFKLRWAGTCDSE